MNYIRLFIIAVICMAFLSCAWYGAEMLIYGESQRSIVDMGIAVAISLTFAQKLEKGVEENERKRKLTEKFTKELYESVKKGEKAKDGERKET